MVCKTVRNEAKRIKSIVHNSCQGPIMISSKERPDGPLFFMECAGVDLPPGRRESALMEGGAADVIFEGQERKVKMRLEIVYLPIIC